MVPLQRPRTQHKNAKAEVGMVMSARVRPNQHGVQVVLLVPLSQIGARRVDLGVVLAPDKILFGRFQTI